jgi:hypothetical protein
VAAVSAEVGDALGLLMIDTGTGPRRVRLADYLDGDAEEHATAAAHAWIKTLRTARVDGVPLRRRFLFRDDSLWWFAELYLHKRRVILEMHRALAALERLLSSERPVSITPVGRSRLLAVMGPQAAAARNIRWIGPTPTRAAWLRVLAMDTRACALMLASQASRLRRRPAPVGNLAGPGVVAFVHNAFWRRRSKHGSPESYIGPVLDALEAAHAGGVNYVGVGPASNFRARRWWHPFRTGASTRVIPIESLATRVRMKGSTGIWRARHAMRRALSRSDDLRRHAVIGGCDCWPIVREELAGVALLQWPWSARAMDEAAAALDLLRPAVVMTYAEAGGWGRALMLECRRRRIPSAGLQHGFIYRHWLNYRHEPDEMVPDPDHAADSGFPRPTLTLLFDDFARQHLEREGRFPPASLQVTGSPQLDALVEGVKLLAPSALASAKASAGADGTRLLVLVVTKYREARRVLPALADAVRTMPDVQLAIKTHPAETPDAYAELAASAANIRVLPSDAALAPLLAASRAVVTVNSTVALDAAVLGIPALVLGLPNNLSPFVDAGLMAGTTHGESPGPILRRILYDEELRQQLDRYRRAYLARFGIGSDGRAAARAAAAVLGLATAPKLPPGSDPLEGKDSH